MGDFHAENEINRRFHELYGKNVLISVISIERTENISYICMDTTIKNWIYEKNIRHFCFAAGRFGF